MPKIGGVIANQLLAELLEAEGMLHVDLVRQAFARRPIFRLSEKTKRSIDARWNLAISEVN